MPTLLLKSLRDLRARRWQVIGLTLLAALLVTSTAGAERGRRMLVHTRDVYYEELAYPHLEIRCSPTIPGLLERVADVDGIEAAKEIPTYSGVVHFGDGASRTSTIRVLPDGGQPATNRLALLDGRLPAPGEKGVVLDRSMRTGFGIQVGDQVDVEMLGERHTLPVLGVALSPEYILVPCHPQYLIPVPGTLGALSMSAAAAKAYPRGDLVSSIQFRFESGADAEALQDELLEKLAVSPIAVFPRADAPGHRATALMFPFFDIYLPVIRTVLVLLVLSLITITLWRIVQADILEIGVLAATGQRPSRIAASYVVMPAFTAVVGGLIGLSLHAKYGGYIYQSYVNAVGFPAPRDPGPGPETWIAVGGLFLVTTAIAFALAYHTARRRPQRLLKPPPPRGYTFPAVAHFFSALRTRLHVPLSVVLGLTYLSRRRWASVATVVSLASTLAVVVSFLYVHVTHITETDAHLAVLGRDATVHFTQPVPDEELAAIGKRVEGKAEPAIATNLVVELSGRRLFQRAFCLPPDGWISNLRMARGRPLEDPAAREVVIDEWLSDAHGVDVGDSLTCFPWYSAPESTAFEIVGVLDGPSHGMVVLPLEAGREMLGLPGLSTAIDVTSDLPTDTLMARLRALEHVETVQSMNRVRERVGMTFGGLRRVLILAVIVAVLVGALFLALLAALDAAERAPDLAVLRALGWRERSMLSLCVTEVVPSPWEAPRA